MEIALVVLVVVLVAAGAVAVGRRLGAGEPGPRPRPWETPEPGGDVVVLDLVPDDPEHPSVQRLVEEVGRRALLAEPELDRVEVRDRDGRVLGHVTPPPPLPADLALPADLHEPHARRSRTPSPVPRGETTHPVPPSDDVSLRVEPRPFADQFDLDDRIRAQLRDPDDPVDLVRSILTAAGHDPEVSDGLLLLDGVAVLVLPDPGHAVDDELARAFLRIQQARVPRGIIVHLGWVNPEALRRRERAAPNVRHVSVEAIQRMADAVAAGADPVAFAVGPAVVR